MERESFKVRAEQAHRLDRVPQCAHAPRLAVVLLRQLLACTMPKVVDRQLLERRLQALPRMKIEGQYIMIIHILSLFQVV